MEGFSVQAGILTPMSGANRADTGQTVKPDARNRDAIVPAVRFRIRAHPAAGQPQGTAMTQRMHHSLGMKTIGLGLLTLAALANPASAQDATTTPAEAAAPAAAPAAEPATPVPATPEAAMPMPDMPAHDMSMMAAAAAPPAAAAPAELPKKGDTMRAVEKRYGAPKLRHKPVGGDSPVHPPITRWDYDGFSVVFENSHVVSAVVPDAPPALHHAEQLAPADH